MVDALAAARCVSPSGGDLLTTDTDTNVGVGAEEGRIEDFVLRDGFWIKDLLSVISIVTGGTTGITKASWIASIPSSKSFLRNRSATSLILTDEIRKELTPAIMRHIGNIVHRSDAISEETELRIMKRSDVV
jgi:hypothetical protein